VTAANTLETLRASRMYEETTASGKSCNSRSSTFLILLLLLDLAACNKAFDLFEVALFALRKIVAKKVDRSNAAVPGDDKIGSRVSWWFAGSARYPSNPSGIT
jgi:hypothetical protein